MEVGDDTQMTGGNGVSAWCWRDRQRWRKKQVLLKGTSIVFARANIPPIMPAAKELVAVGEFKLR